MPKVEITELLNRQHDQAAGIDTHKVTIFGYDPVGKTPRRIAVKEGGQIISTEDRPTCTYTWTDGLLAQKVAVYADRTETTTYEWTDGKLTNKETLIT